MGISSCKPVYARHRYGQDRPTDPAQARPFAWARCLAVCACLSWFSIPAVGQSIRIATFNVALGHKGPGLLLDHILKGKEAQISALITIIATVKPDILLLTDFDYDYGNQALSAFAARLGQAGVEFPYIFAFTSNAGRDSGVDLNGDGLRNGPADAQGFGRFSGQGAMALLSRFPIDGPGAFDFSRYLWRDLPGAQMAKKQGQPFPSAKTQSLQRLPNRGFWAVPITLPDSRKLTVLASHMTPPVFDGPEDLNGKRGRDELRFWSLYLNGFDPFGMGQTLKGDFVLLGDFNADPMDGEGAHQALLALLKDAKLQDPQPESRGATAASTSQGSLNLSHKNPANQDTVDWSEGRGPGNLRVDYVLPSSDFAVTGAGVFWPAPWQSGFELIGLDGDLASRHRLVWVDLR